MSEYVDFDKSFQLGKAGEHIIQRILTENGVTFEDVSDDCSYWGMGVDLILNHALQVPIKVDVKTHSQSDKWNTFPVEVWSDVKAGKKGCDFKEAEYVDYFYRVFPLTHQILCIKQPDFINYVESCDRWKNLKSYVKHNRRIVDGKERLWDSEFKDWEIDYLPMTGLDKWWKKIKFVPTMDEMNELLRAEYFRNSFIKYQQNHPIPFVKNDKIRCPFCMEKGRPGDMILTNNTKDGSLFFKCENCFKEHRRDKSVDSSFNVDGWKYGKYKAKFPLLFLQEQAGK